MAIFEKKPHILMFMLELNLQILLPLFRFLKVNIDPCSPWFLSSLLLSIPTTLEGRE